MKRKTLIITISVILLTLLGILTWVGWYVVDYSLCPNNHRGKDIDGAYRAVYKAYPELEAWHDSLTTCELWRDTFIINPEGIKLHAVYIPCDSAVATTIVIHGYTDNAVRMMRYAYLHHHELHCNVLIPDLQFHGLSQGNAIQMGWKDRLDIMQWINVAHQLWPQEDIVLHGVSMGAATTMMTSGETLPTYVKAFIADCGYTSVWDQFAKELDEQFGLPTCPFLYIASAVCDLRYGWTFGQASPLRQVAKCERPIFFIHGDKDDFVPTQMAYQLYDAKQQGERELWITTDTDHARSIRYHWDEYKQRIRQFIDRHIK